MIKLLKRLLAWFLEKIAARIHEQPKETGEGYFNKNNNEETLPEAIKAVLLNTANSLRAEKNAPTENEDGISENIPKQSFASRMKGSLNSCKAKVATLPKWLKLALISTLPVCFLYIIAYFFLVTPPNTNSEDVFRYKEGKPLVRIGYVKEWPTSVVFTSLIAETMDANLNVDITTKAISQNNLADLWQMMVTDRADITPSVWLPNTHAAFIHDAGSDIVDLGVWLQGAKLGLAVPEYMNIDSIEQLAKSNYSGVIYGIDPDSKLQKMTLKAIELYGLKNIRVIAKSDKFMLGKLEEALKKKENIVVAIWTPHWIFGEWEVKMLNDPLGVYGKSEDIHIIATEKFYSKFPDICSFLATIKLDLQEISELMASSRHMNSAGGAASKWMHTHKEKVLQWVEESTEE